ncbi:MAG: tetratricopeptide repeat protein, partial [Candidatus Aminicenantales bacterium]
ESILRRALTKKPDKRYGSAKEVAEALKGLKAQVISGTTRASRHVIFRRSRKKLWVGAMAGVFVLAAFVLTWMMTRPSLAFQSRDRLLVADVENLTGDSVFDLALRTAIEADLQQSPYVSIFDRNQAAETLRMMRVEPSSRIDEALGTEVCRFAGVRALILPRILSAGRAYELQAILVDPVRKRHVDRIRVMALGKEDVLLNAIDTLAQKTRTRLGESLESIQKADVPLVQATTSSWEALHYLAMGQAKWHEGKFKDAAAFFELALEKDPRFVTARGSLGLVMIQWLGKEEEGKAMLRQALADAEGLPQREYLAIRAVNKQYAEEDLEGALEEYRMMRELFPDTMIAYNNPGIILRGMGRYDEAVALFEKASEVAPTNSIPLANLWWTHLSLRKDPAAAEKVARRLLSLSPTLAVHHHWLGYALAAQGRFEEAITACEKALSLDAQHPYALPNMAHLLVAVGRAGEAVPVYRKVLDLVRQKKIPGYAPFSWFELAFALRESGRMDEAITAAEEGKSLLSGPMEAPSPQAWVLLTMAQLAAVSGQTAEAEGFLKRALAAHIPDAQTRLSLAEVYALLGQEEEAVQTLKKTLDSGYADPYYPLIRPAFQSLRTNPGFRALFGLE